MRQIFKFAKASNWFIFPTVVLDTYLHDLTVVWIKLQLIIRYKKRPWEIRRTTEAIREFRKGVDDD
jgi:hypothetical protein